MENVNNKYLNKHKKFRTDSKSLALTFFVIALVVAIVVFWWLKLVGVTMTGDAFCGMYEHTHGDACYEQELICELTDEPATEATEATPEETTPTHVHTDECYRRTLVCTKAEHVHTQDCFPDTTANVETVSDWLATIQDVEITNSVPDNLINIALTQIGYTESKDNFEYDHDGIKHGYTRYGQWYGNPYSDWNTTFVSFCLHYSNVDKVDELKSAGAESMRLAWQQRLIYAAADKYTPQRGDVVFIDDNGDGVADSTAIVLSTSDEDLITVYGDSNDTVEIVHVPLSDHILGYGLTGQLKYAKDHTPEETPEDPDEEKPTNVRSPLMLFSTGRATITNTSDLGDLLVSVEIKNQDGSDLGDGNAIYVGDSYNVTLEFSEINTGSQWVQLKQDADGYLTYQLPDNLLCAPTTVPSIISAKTEDGVIQNVGEYIFEEGGLLKVHFYDIGNGQNFLDLYSNVNFTVDFDAVVVLTEGENDTNVNFGNEIDINLTVKDGGEIQVDKVIGDYDPIEHTVDYTIRVEATHGFVNDLVLTDEIDVNHSALRDTIVVTDLDGIPLDPQPIIGDTPNPYYNAGFQLTGFPDMVAGEGFLITYKSKINDDKMYGDKLSMWNGAYAKGTGNNPDTIVDDYVEAWQELKMEKMDKEGNQTFLTDKNGNVIPAIKWDIVIRKTQDLHGSVIIDTLGDGLTFYRDAPIVVQCYDLDGTYLGEVNMSWDDVIFHDEKNIEFNLPSGYAFEISYYTTYEDLQEGEEKEFENDVSAIINGHKETVGGTADVVGIVPRVDKTAKGTDGENVYFTIEANVPGVIKDWGHFYLTDRTSTWNAALGEYLYVNNVPENLVVTAVTNNGDTITFTPYVPGGPEENTYILVCPAEEDFGTTYYGFQIFFNTSVATTESSKWTLAEDSVLTITYQLPFDATTGTQWTGELTGDKTLGDVMAEDGVLTNEALLHYTQTLLVNHNATYQYNPAIVKKSYVNADGTIDYTVTFNNSNPEGGAYLNADTISAYFDDVFDKKLEYVPGSLMVTCYPYWSNTEWYNKYTYPGDIEGHSMHIATDEFVYHSTHPKHQGWPDLVNCETLEDYYSLESGGNFVFTYSLRIKDEYLYTTDYSVLELVNSSEITWDEEGSSGTATITDEFRTGLLDKQSVKVNDNLDFAIHLNRNALDLLENTDTLTIVDVMTPNISVYWDTIQLYYEDEQGNWINFDSPESIHEHTVAFDQYNNKLTFTVPDELHVKIDYTTLINETGLVSVNNSVAIEGKSYATAFSDAVFKVESHSGEATGSSNKITLLKHDGVTGENLPNVEFHLYGPVGNPDAEHHEGLEYDLIMEDGTPLHYIGTFTTGADGTTVIQTQYLTLGGPYALVEHEAPEGYIQPTKPVYFYYCTEDPNGIIQTVTTIVTVENFRHSFALPETGDASALIFGIIGIAAMAVPIVYSTIRRKRERRLTQSPVT